MPEEGPLAPDLLVRRPGGRCRRLRRGHQGGGIDYPGLGIGSDGHIGFNVFGGTSPSRTPRGRPDRNRPAVKTIARFFDGDTTRSPRTASQGLGTIMDSRAHLHRQRRRMQSRAMIEGGVTSMLARVHPQHHLPTSPCLDEAAASKLELAGLLQGVWEIKASASPAPPSSRTALPFLGHRN